jgi:hypothetical protein
MEENARAPEISEQDLERPKDETFGVIESWAQLAVGMGETIAKSSFGLAQDFRGETKTRVDATLQWAEDVTRGSFRLARQMTQHTDKIAGEGIARCEYAVMVTLRAMRRTSHDIASLTSTTLSGAVGGNGTIPRPKSNATLAAE